MNDEFVVDVHACRGRQQRLLAELDRVGVEYVLLTQSESVQWLTGTVWGMPFTGAAGIDRKGFVTAVVPRHLVDAPIAADEVIAYDAQLQATLTENQAWRCVQAWVSRRMSLPVRVGCEFSTLHRHWTDALRAEWIDIEPIMLRLRRRKDPDELRMLTRANDANRAMFTYAREQIHAGIHELDLYGALHAVAVQVLGEPLTYFGHDFQCGSIGGPPRNRAARAGELYILDLGVGFRGYRSDNARTFVVDSSASQSQQQAWDAVNAVFGYVESCVRPGVGCAQLFAEVQQQLARHRPWSFEHHLGHGLGLSPHESPRLNPAWNDQFEEGDYFTVEPGLYHDELRYGLRLEQNYLVTGTGVQLLSDWPLEL